MSNVYRVTALSVLTVVASAALVACGGGDDPATAPAASSGGGGGAALTAFATPSTGTATAEGGFLDQYTYAGNAGGTATTTGATVSTTAGIATVSHTVGNSAGWAGVALRAYAPGNASAAGTTPFNASSKTALKIKMATTNTADTSIIVMLHPYTAAGAFDANGCAYKATFTLTAPVTTSQEYSIALNTTNFTYTTGGSCAATAPAFSSITGNLYGIDVRNEGHADGTHDVKVEYIKFQ